MLVCPRRTMLLLPIKRVRQSDLTTRIDPLGG